MKNGSVFFPLGASHAPYLRAKGPDISEWRDDLEKMKMLGMTCLDVFASWHRLEPEEGKFDFSELDYIFRLAGEIGLKVSVVLGCHIGYGIYPPRWIMRGYRNGGMVDQNGCRDVDGTYAQPCFEEEEYRACAERYFRKLVKRYADHPALMQWIVWGEATLSRYCWCETHQKMFREYLKQQYGSLEALNQAWGTEGPSGFESFEEIYPPKKQYRFYGYRETLDWQDFLDRSLTAAVQRVNEWVKSEDPNHPTTGEFWLPEGNSSGGGDDIWKLAKTADRMGLSIYNKPSWSCAKDMDLISSAARLNGKEAWVIEVQGGTRIFSFGWDEPYAPSADQATLWMWQFIAHDAKGICYWTWRPRISDLEGGEFGIARRDGTLPDRALEMGREFRFLQTLAPDLLASSRSVPTAILFSREAEHLAAIDRIDRADKSYYAKSVYSAHELLWRGGFPADFIGEWKIEFLKRYKVLILPFQFCITPQQADALKQFVADGGTVIADFQLGSKDGRGYCDSVIPGFGLSEVFGIAEDEILNGEKQFFTLEDGRRLFINLYVQTCRLRGAEPFGFFQGKPVCTRHAYGKGTAIFLGTVFFHRDTWRAHRENADFLYDLLHSCGAAKEVAFRPEGNPEDSPELPETVVRKMENGDRIVFLLNHCGTPVSGTIRLEGTPAACVTNLRTEEKIPFHETSGAVEFPAAANAKQCALYRIGVKK